MVAASPQSAELARDQASDIAEIAGRAAGRVITVEVVARETGLADSSRQMVIGTGGGEADRSAAAAPEGADDPERHPLVQLAAEVFGARVTRVERRLGDGGPGGQNAR